MSDEVTEPLAIDEKLNLILAELSGLREWRARVDAFIDERTRDTRPMLDLIHKELADTRLDVTELKEGQGRMETQLARIESKFDVLLDDVMEVRGAQRALDKRLLLVERRSA